MPNRPIRVGLLWHSSNSGNLGVGALTVSDMAIARQVAVELDLEPRFTIVGMRDSGRGYVLPHEADIFEVDGRSLLSPWGCAKVLGEQDCVLDIGAGDSFAEIYGLKRFLFLWWTKVLTLVQGVPLLLAPQTIGPFTRAPYRGLAALVLNRAHAVLARDDLSLSALRDIAPRSRGVLAVDVAFALPYEDRSDQRGAGGRIRVGVNVSGLLFGEAERGTNRFALSVDYAVLMRRFIETLSEQPQIEVHLVAHVINRHGDEDDDTRLADRLAAEYPRAVRAPDFASPSEAKSYISGLDFLVAGRMHACIAALSSGTPVAPVAYSRKFSGLFKMLDYGWTLPVKGLDTDQALHYLLDCLERRAEMAADGQKGMGKVAGLLDAYREELRSLFKAAAAA